MLAFAIIVFQSLINNPNRALDMLEIRSQFPYYCPSCFFRLVKFLALNSTEKIKADA